ncbi:MAG: hypothetical protein KC464_17930 [Myxococcales bacterium]|nr:hypothetical protein [Myxococcales bacterium]
MLVGLVGLAVPSAGCKSSDKPDPLTDPVKKPQEGKGPHRGGMVRLATNEPKFVNPVLEPRFTLANELIFEGLVGLDAKLEPVKRLAESWEISPDGKTITFKLRDGVLWHDGEKFTSADVAFTFEAIRATPAASTWRAYMAPVQSLATPDERTVVVTYAEPYAPALVTWTVGILPKHLFVDKDGAPIDITTAQANTEPVGTGPFKLSRWELGKRMYLEANERWWYRKPNLDGVELVFGVGEADALEELRHGRLDLARIGDVQQWMTVGMTGEFRDDFEASEAVESRIRLLAWNTQRTPFDKAEVRKALTLALDRKRVIEDVLLGQAQALSAPLFPNMFGYDPSVAPLPYDPAAAKTLLDAAAPLKGGKRFSVDVISVESLKGPTADGMAAIFRHDLEQVGVDFKLTFLPAKEYYERIAKRDYDGVYFGWLPDIPDPDPSALLHSSQAKLGANYAAYANPDVDILVEQARRTLDRDERRKAYEGLQRILADELPYTPLFAPYGHYAWSRTLHGVNPRDVTPQAPLPGIAAWWLTKAP